MLLRPAFLLALSLQAVSAHAETPQLDTFLPQDFLAALTTPLDGLSGFDAENVTATAVLRGLFYAYGADNLNEQIKAALEESDGDPNAAFAQIVRQATPGTKLAIEHLEAFDLGRQIYIDNAVARDERYGAEGRLSIARIEARLAGYQQRYSADTPVAIQRVIAGQSFDDIMRNVLNGNISSADAVQDLTDYSSAFVDEYLMNPAFKSEFPQDVLQIAMEITELKAEEERLAAEEERLAAEERAAEQRIQDGFRQLVEKLERARDDRNGQ